MKVFSYRLSILLGIVVVGHFQGFAQSRIVTTIPSGKVVEITKSYSQSPVQIPLTSREPNGFWTSNVDRIKGWTLPEGALPIQVVNFDAKLVGDKAEVRVSVFSGTRFRENDDLIAT